MKAIELLKRLPLEQMGADVLIDLGTEKIFISRTGQVSDTVEDMVDVTLRLSEDDLVAVLEGKENVISLFTMGRIEVEGDMDLAIRLKDILG
jgi:putative sterol carrier protein